MKLEEVAKQASADAKDQIIMKKLEELSQIAQETLNQVSGVEPSFDTSTRSIILALSTTVVIISCF